MRMTSIVICCLVLVYSCPSSAFDQIALDVVEPLGHAVDVYRISIQSGADADAANAAGVQVLMPVNGGYLVLADSGQARALADAKVSARLIAQNIDRRELALDIRADGQNIGRYPILWEEGNIRLFRISRDRAAEVKQFGGIAPLPVRTREMRYTDGPEIDMRLASKALHIDLDSLVDLVSQDSLESYSYAMQSFFGRTPGSTPSNACKNWLLNKFLEFGYDSIVTHSFTEESWWGEPISGVNVVAYKIGSLYPYDYIVIGAHRDAVGGSPGADDNGSGVAAVMEMARILRNVETNMTVIFALFDAEELGLLGAEAFAREASERGDRIVFMLNLDMISFYRNYNDAYLYHGLNTEYAELWVHLADSVAGINIAGHLNGGSGASDHAPFIGHGYDAIFVHEYIFSTVYHSSRDSTTYMDFDYMTRMTMASLATAYYTDGTHVPDPTLVILPAGKFSTIIYPDSLSTISVEIQEYAGGILIPGSVLLQYSINDGPVQTMPLTDMGGGIYETDMPPMSCLDRIRYSIIAGEQSQGQFIWYPKFNEWLDAIKAAALLVLLDDNFESDNGWTVQGNAANGWWERWRASSNSAQPRQDYDGSGKCYLTNHAYASDVDDGTTSLISPELDISHGDAVVEYARWYANNLGGASYEDVFEVFFYHGQQLVPVETVGPLDQATGGWYIKRFRVGEFFQAVEPFRLRFDASDLYYDSGVEAAVDAVRVILYSEAPYIITDLCPDGTIDIPYAMQLDASGCADPITWEDKNGDLGGTGLTLAEDGMLSGIVSDTGIITFTANARDATGVSSEKEFTVHVWMPFVCGDANRDGSVNITDPVFIVNFIFKNGPDPYPMEVADANGDGEINVGDAVAMIDYIFKGGDPPQCK